MAMAVKAWQASPQRAVHTVQCLLATRLVSPSAVVQWAFASPVLLSLANAVANDLAWELVDLAIAHSLSVTQVWARVRVHVLS